MPRSNDDPGFRDRFRRGDRETTESVYRETFEAVRRAATRVLREPADGDAVVQQVFTDLVGSRKLRDSYAGGDLGAWLGAIARNRAIDFARRERRLRDLSELDDAPAPADPLHEFRQELERFAGRLAPEKRRVLELRYLAGMTQVEAAERLGMPRSTLEDWERQIKRLLAERLLGGEAMA